MSEAPIIPGYAAPQPAGLHPPEARFPALHYPNYRRWFVGASISVIGTWMSATAIAWILWDETHRSAWVALAGVCFQVPSGLLVLVGGLAADRFDKRTILLVTQSVFLAASLLMAAMSHWGLLAWPAGPWLILLLAALRGSVMGFDMPARQAFTLEMVHRDALQSAVSLNSGIFNLGRTIGPALAGLLMATAGATICFLVDAASYVAVLIALARMRLQRRARRSPRRAYRLHELKMGVRAAAGNARILTFIGLSAAGVFAAAYGTLLPAFAEDVFQGDSKLLGYLSAAAGAGAFVGAVVVSVLCRKGRQAWWIFAGLLAMAAFLLAAALAPNWLTASGIIAALGFATMCTFSPSNAAVQLASSERYRGRILGVLSLVFILAMPVGNVFFGLVADWVGPRGSVAAGAVLTLLLALTLGRRAARRYGNG